MDRIYGVETEYGLVARSDTGRMSASEAAGWLFRPVERHHRATNVFLANGGRLYLDVGAHPEFATPECRRIDDVLVAERAGDEIVTRLAAAAVAEAAAEGVALRVRLFKNNLDSHGNSFGCHENYLVSRDLDLAGAVDLLTAFLVTRQILCGAGRWQRGAFLVSQRADHLHDLLSAMTTRARPLVNTRDEPLADPARWRRLHVLAGDSNLSEPSARLKLGSLELVLRLVESPAGPKTSAITGLRLADPAAALRQVARDPRAPVALAEGGTATAVSLQRQFLDLVEPDPAFEEVTAAWARVLDAVEAGDPDRVAGEVEWAAKRRLLAEFRDRHALEPTDPRLAQVDLAFHELGGAEGRPTGLFRLLEARGAVTRLTDPTQVERAISEPPPDTRAALRSRFVLAAQNAGRDHSVDWQTFTVHDLPGPDGRPQDRRVVCSDPFTAVSAEVDALIADLANQPRVRHGSGFRPPG